MIELGWIGDLALGAAALAGVRSLRQGLHEASEALAGRLDDHEERPWAAAGPCAPPQHDLGTRSSGRSRSAAGYG